MVIAVALTFYAGLALAVARLLSLNGRWERALGAVVDAEGALASAIVAPPFETRRESVSHRDVGARGKKPRTEPVTTPATEAAALDDLPIEEPVLVDVGF